MEGAVLEESRELHIQYVPETKLVLGKSLNPDNIRESSDVYYDCLVDANPPIYKVEWRHNGRQLNHNISGGVIIANQSLVLQGVSRASAGNYTCVGFNQEGEGVSNSFYLNVMFAPTCEPNQTRVHGVAKQEKANISCAVDANPGDVEFRWTFNNSAESVEVETSHITRHGTVSTVSYTPMTELDYGTLLCYAKNRIGSQRVPCVYHIIAAGRPDSVLNCSVANTSMTSFSVRCFEGFNGGLPQSFLLEVRDPVSQALRANVTSGWPAFQVDRLEAGASYQACVYSVNSKGRSDPVILQASTIRPAEKQLHPDKGEPRSAFRLTPLTSTLVGGVLALFVIAAVVCVSVRARCCTGADKRRPRAKEAPEQDDKGSLPGAGSPHSAKLGDSSGGDGTTDSDEKNPDIIPQAGATTADSADHSDLVRRRQHVSTIETSGVTSPSRTLLQGVQQGYPGYCTLRNGMPPAMQGAMQGAMPLQDLGGHPKPKMKPVDMSAYSAGGGCPTLPRGGHWSSYGVRMMQGYPAPGSVPGGGGGGPGHAGTLLLRHPHHQQGSYMGHPGHGLGPGGLGHGPGHTQTLPRHHGGLHHPSSMAGLGGMQGLHHNMQLQAMAGNSVGAPHGLQQPQQHAAPSSDEDQPGVDTPLMVSKRESTV
ncbi:nephrin [Frankliniella occidentalis]|uniref:Nephrin n=1 Tax=Frankliniella occidentalis TaxID=133901 RepID=A0A9C6WR08_FRAOC|nr:nephrin [Frankliniella occidentalis]